MSYLLVSLKKNKAKLVDFCLHFGLHKNIISILRIPLQTVYFTVDVTWKFTNFKNLRKAYGCVDIFDCL